MSDPQPLVSVVTPFYNVEKYLEEAVRSVLAQTYGNWEYILLDNASTDRSAEIARDYAARDPRIRLSRNPALLAQVPNYNAALRLVADESRFVKIVQADDWIFPECLERMVQLAAANPSVGIVSSYVLCGTEIAGGGLPYQESVFNGRDVCRRQLLEGSFYFGSPSSVLYRADIVRARTPFYREGRLHEDTEVCYEILRTHDFGFVHQVLSFMRMDNLSISTSVRNFNPNGLDRLIVVNDFGKDFLSADEYAAVLARAERNYYGDLGRSMLRFRGRRFWDYHREGLATIGRTLHWRKLLPGALRELAELTLNPKRTLTSAFRTFAGPRRGSGH